MKTTLELPDDLMMRIKLLALKKRQKLREAIAEYLEKGIAVESTRTSASWAENFPEPVKLRGRGPLTTDEIEAAINWGRE